LVTEVSRRFLLRRRANGLIERACHAQREHRIFEIECLRHQRRHDTTEGRLVAEASELARRLVQRRELTERLDRSRERTACLAA
jgi:hypothetical protein